MLCSPLLPPQFVCAILTAKGGDIMGDAEFRRHLEKKASAEAEAKKEAKLERDYKVRAEIREIISLVLSAIAIALSVFSLWLQWPWF
jgi:hypothetical protein